MFEVYGAELQLLWEDDTHTTYQLKAVVLLAISAGWTKAARAK
jgi:hypothetical protein